VSYLRLLNFMFLYLTLVLEDCVIKNDEEGKFVAYIVAPRARYDSGP